MEVRRRSRTDRAKCDRQSALASLPCDESTKAAESRFCVCRGISPAPVTNSVTGVIPEHPAVIIRSTNRPIRSSRRVR